MQAATTESQISFLHASLGEAKAKVEANPSASTERRYGYGFRPFLPSGKE
jgi:hypothetical protein